MGEHFSNIAKKIPARPEISAIPYQRTVAKIYNPLNKSRNSYIYLHIEEATAPRIRFIRDVLTAI